MKLGFSLSVSGTVEGSDVMDCEQQLLNIKRQIFNQPNVTFNQVASNVGDYGTNAIGGVGISVEKESASNAGPTIEDGAPTDFGTNPATTTE